MNLKFEHSLAGWGLERGRENIARRIPTPLLSVPLPFAPTAIVPLPEGPSFAPQQGSHSPLCKGVATHDKGVATLL